MAIPIIFRSTDPLKWGTGKGSKLTIAEGDGNLWELQKAIQALIDNPPEAASIANIQVVGSAMQITLTDSQVFGPFKLPVAAFRYRDEGFVDAVAYDELDLIPIIDQGLYLVLQDHTAVAPFDPARQIGGEDVYQLLFGQDQSEYLVHFSIPGKPGDGFTEDEPIAMHIVGQTSHALATDTNSLSYLNIPSDDNLVLNIQKNGVTVGTITFPTSNGGVIAWSADVEFLADDEIYIGAPSATDATAKGMSVRLNLRVGNLPT
jgi:hypothetical protein